MKANARTVLTTIAITLLVIFILQNIRAAMVKFIIWNATLPIALIVAVAFGIGFGVAWFWRRKL